jgi:adenylate cyclase
VLRPRSMLCGAGCRVDAHIPGHFQELRELCAAAGSRHGRHGDDRMMQARLVEASRLASEQMMLPESIGDPALTVGAGFMAIRMKYGTGEVYRNQLRCLELAAAIERARQGDPP